LATWKAKNSEQDDIRSDDPGIKPVPFEFTGTVNHRYDRHDGGCGETHGNNCYVSGTHELDSRVKSHAKRRICKSPLNESLGACRDEQLLAGFKMANKIFPDTF